MRNLYSLPRPALRTVAALLCVCLAWSAAPALAESAVVNVNSASVAELSLLPRVGPSVAARIVEYRDQNGRFKQAEELMLVRGIGEKTFALIEPHVVLTGNTTLRDKVSSSGSNPSSASNSSSNDGDRS